MKELMKRGSPAGLIGWLDKVLLCSRGSGSNSRGNAGATGATGATGGGGGGGGGGGEEVVTTA